MGKMPTYSRFQQEQLSLRDELAVDRTVLSNERTLLAYVRTALGFLILGLTFLHFLQQQIYRAAGYALMAVAALVLVLGIVRFVQMQRELTRVRLLTSTNKDAARTERGE